MSPIFSEMPQGRCTTSGFGEDRSGYSLPEYSQIEHVAVARTGLATEEWHRTILAIRR
jgi:hypothetical protein